MIRCKVCNRAGSKDGFCKDHRVLKEDEDKVCKIEGCHEPRHVVSAGECEMCRKHFYGDEELDLVRKSFSTNETTPSFGYAQKATPGAFHTKPSGISDKFPAEKEW